MLAGLLALMSYGVAPRVARGDAGRSAAAAAPIVRAFPIPNFSLITEVADPAIGRALLYGSQGRAQLFLLYDLSRGTVLARMPVPAAQAIPRSSSAASVLDSSHRRAYVLYAARPRAGTRIWGFDLAAGRLLFTRVVAGGVPIGAHPAIDQAGKLLCYEEVAVHTGVALVLVPLEAAGGTIRRIAEGANPALTVGLALDDASYRLVRVALGHGKGDSTTLHFTGYPLTGGPAAWQVTASFMDVNGLPIFDPRDHLFYTADLASVLLVRAADGRHIRLNYHSPTAAIGDPFATPDDGVIVPWAIGASAGLDRLSPRPPYRTTIARVTQRQILPLINLTSSAADRALDLVAERHTPRTLCTYYLLGTPNAGRLALVPESALITFDWRHGRVSTRHSLGAMGVVLSSDASNSLLVLALGTGKPDTMLLRYAGTTLLTIRFPPS